MKKINYMFFLIIIYLGCENNPLVSIDCNGIENGISIEDNCGICDDNPTNDCTQDCFGIWGGENFYDECGTCNGNGKLDCNNECILPNAQGNYSGNGVDCFGICGGNATVDECQVCNGAGAVYLCGCTGIQEGECDCNGNIMGCDNVCGSGLIEDCNEECGGISTTDECGVCGGQGPETNFDCNGNCIVDFDECGECGGDGTSCDNEEFEACNMPINNIFLLDGSVFYNVNFNIKGFQFNIDGATASGASGGDAAIAGFTVSVGGSTVLGFSFTGASIPSGCGLLTVIGLIGDDSTGLSNIIFDDGNDDTDNVVQYYEGP